MSSVSITLSSQAQKLLANAQTFPARLLPSLVPVMDRENELTTGHIQRRRMTGKGPFSVDQGKLGVRTNRLRSSVRPAKATLSGQVILSGIGSNVKYAGVHEFGFSGVVQVKTHKRRNAANDRYESRGKSGRLVKTQSGIRETVEAHQMRMNMPKRAPIYNGISDRLQRYRAAVSRATVAAFNPSSAT